MPRPTLQKIKRNNHPGKSAYTGEKCGVMLLLASVGPRLSETLCGGIRYDEIGVCVYVLVEDLEVTRYNSMGLVRCWEVCDKFCNMMAH